MYEQSSRAERYEPDVRLREDDLGVLVGAPLDLLLLIARVLDRHAALKDNAALDDNVGTLDNEFLALEERGRA